MPISTKFISPKMPVSTKSYRKETFVQGGNYALSAWNFRASECRAELVRTMPNAAENLEEEALQSVAIVTGYEVPGRNCCSNSAWKAVRLWRCL